MPTVCLVVIARNEAPRIARLLHSVAPWVDRMLVLDTGSTDETAALAAAAGAELRSFAWCDDFAAARNAALDAAGADWHLVLDADEWLMEGGDAVAALRQQRPDFVGSVLICSEFDGPQGVQTQHSRISRVLPGGVRYAGRVHEQPQHDLPVRALPLRVAHDGYRQQALAQKQGRNLALLQQLLVESPHDAYAWYQLGKDHAVYERHAEAEGAFERAAALAQGHEPWWGDLMPRRLYGLKCLQRHQEGMDWAFGQLQAGAESPDFFFALGDLLLDAAVAQPDLVAQLLPMAEDCWRRCLQIGERPEQAHAVAGRGSYHAAHNLALILDATGRPDEAAQLRAAHPPP